MSPGTEGAWPPGRGPRLLIADGWYANAGDGAIVLAMARSIARVLPEARMLFCAPHRHLIERHYPGLSFTDPLEVLADSGSDLIAQAHAVISKGGGHLFEHYPLGGRLRAYAAVRAMGTPMAFWSQSVGWFADEALRAELKRALENAKLFCAREPETVEVLASMGIEGTIRLSADEALMLPVRAPGAPGAVCGVALNSLALTRPGQPAQTPGADLIERHAEIVERLATGGPVRACSTVQGFGELSDEIEDDSRHHHEVGGLLSEQARQGYEVVDGFLAPHLLRERLRGLDVLVSSRMHAALLAMLEGVPAVYVTPNFKGVSLFRRLGLEELVVPDADPVAVLESVTRARALRQSLGTRLARLRRVVRPTAVAVTSALALAEQSR